MKVLGIDVGPETSGVVVFDAEFGRVVYSCSKESNEQLVKLSFHTDVGAVVMEVLSSYGMAIGASTFNAIWWSGRLYEHFRRSWPVHTITRVDVKKSLLGRANIDRADTRIRELLLERVGPKGTKKAPGPCYGVSSHSWQALAAVVAHLDSERLRAAG